MNYPIVVYDGGQSLIDDRRRLSVYLLIVGFANLFALTAEPYWGDMGYWWDWTTHLRGQGYQGFDGNYPPVYIHWLYVVGQFYEFFHLSLTKDFLLKILVELPIIAAHFVLIRIVHQVLIASQVQKPHYHWVMILASLNPAIIVDGPVWGQVDLLPVTFVVYALYKAASNRGSLLVMPLYILALLTKFQMICFAPVFGFYFFSDWRKHSIGVALGLVLAVVILLPFYINGELSNLFLNAYVHTTGQYPYSTYNAANVWFLVQGNDVKDTTAIFKLSEDVALNAKILGIGAFSLISIFVFSFGLASQVKGDILFSRGRIRTELIYASVIMAVSFFFVLPGMHERYLMPAVPIALLLIAYKPDKLYLAAALTLWTFLNIVLIHPLSGEKLWAGLAILGALTFVLTLVSILTSITLRQRFVELMDRIVCRYTWLPESMASIILLVVIVFLSSKLVVPNFDDMDGRKWLSDLEPVYERQGWGKLNNNLNSSARTLKAKGVVYSKGLGVHAPSTIRYKIPSGYTHLIGQAALDDEGKSGRVSFKIKLDSKLVWNSGPVEGFSAVQSFEVALNGAKNLELQVDELGNKNFDHSDWLNIALVDKSD